MSQFALRSMSRCRAGALAGALAASLLASCTTITTAPSDSRLSGHWVLDPAASDDAAARVGQAVTDAVKKMRARRLGTAGEVGGGGAGGSGGAGGGGGTGGGGGRRGSGNPRSGPDQGAGPGQAPEPAQPTAPRGDGTDDAPESIIDQYGNTRLLGPDLRALSANLVHAVSGPREVELQVDGDSVRVRADGLPARDYRLGEGFSRFDEYGTARMQPGWSGDAFVLRARYTNGASVTERYEVLRGQSALTRTIDLVDPVVGKLQLHSLYRPAPP
jgi:hypothetical protein